MSKYGFSLTHIFPYKNRIYDSGIICTVFFGNILNLKIALHNGLDLGVRKTTVTEQLKNDEAN